MGRRELREHIFRLLFRRDFFPEEEMKEQEAFYIEYLADPEQKEGYKGFLYVKCQFCGKTKDFCAKETITEAKCLCGEKIPLKNLRPMYVKCDCGKDFRYFTNMTDDRFTCKCINCSSRVKIRMNTRGTAYVTDCRKPAKTPFARNYGGRF